MDSGRFAVGSATSPWNCAADRPDPRMPRRKTSRVRAKKPERRLHIKVNSARIFGYGVLRFGKSLAKLAVVLALVGGAVWGGKVGMRKFFVENPEFQLTEIALETNGEFTEAHFAEVTGIDPSDTVFAIKLSEIRKKLEECPGIVKASVSRRLPGTLKVRIEERIPVAWLECPPLGITGKDPESGLLLDADGICFPCEFWWEEKARPLPVVLVSQAAEGDVTIGKTLRHREAHRGLQLIKLCQARLKHQKFSVPVVAVHNDYALLGATDTGTLVTFGMYEHERQLEDLIALERHARWGGKTMTAVNLIPVRNIPVRFAEEGESAGEVHRGFTPENRLERSIRAILNRG